MKRSALLLVLLVSSAGQAQDLRDVIGVTHVGGKYSIARDGEDFLSEGADRIREELGSRVIKIWLSENPAAYYPFHSPLWLTVQSGEGLASIAAHPYYQRVFRMPFTTFILTIPNGVWFHDGLSPEEEAAVVSSFYELTRRLMLAHAGTNKTFVLQNWEADWLLRIDGSGAQIPEHLDPAPAAVTGMIRWINARQRGVERARAELSDQVGGVRVLHAVEVNHLIRAWREPSRTTVTNHVLPFVRADLYSYSAWESTGEPTGRLLQQMLTFLDERTEGERNIFVGEYGVPENLFGTADHLNRVMRLTEAALEWGARYVIYWQLYCNEFVDQAPRGQLLNVDMRGYWLIRPDGTRSPVWHYLRSRVAPAKLPERRLPLLQVRPLP
jgi:hypothetical protein